MIAEDQPTGQEAGQRAEEGDSEDKHTGSDGSKPGEKVVSGIHHG